MKYYKSETNEIFAYEEDGSQDHLIGNKISITQKEVDDIQKAKLDNRTYAEKRMAEYPLFFDYLDGVVKNDKAQIQAYIDACLAIKDKYPKK